MNDCDGRLIIVGAGSLGMELITWMIDSKIYNELNKRLYFIDDYADKDIHYNKINIKYLGKIDQYQPQKNDNCYLAIANPKHKSHIVKILDEKKANFKSFIHPSVKISPTTKIGRGCIIFPFSICALNSKLNDFIMVNHYSVVGHDVFVDSFTTISSFVALNGNVSIGEKVFIGCGAKFLPNVKIGDSTLIGAGSLICSSIPNNKTVYCQPAKIL
tara:strand:- start:4694 stop:5338 length:645 start_codon:yes stop_codon:yes gene_type:complete